MFGRLGRKVGKIRDEAKKGYEKRKSFVEEISSLWKGFFRKAKGRRLVTSEIPFSEAIRNWGFGFGESGVRKARAATLFMAVFFWIIFFWCSWYFVRSILNDSYIAAISSLIGIGTGFFVGIVNLWRWQVVRHRRYVPFVTWLKNWGSIE